MAPVTKKKTAAQLDREIADALRARADRGHATRRKTKKSPHQIRTRRLKMLQGALEAADGDAAWGDTDLDRLEGFAYVSADLVDELPDDEWVEIARRNIEDQSVMPENAGAPPPRVYAWNDAFINTYRMNLDSGMSEEEARDSARQNAHDTVALQGHEHGLVKTDPKLYED